MSFYTYDPVYCPECAPVFHRKRPEQRTGVTLDCTESNYSGCCVDFGECPKCEKRFQVSYAVKEIQEID